MTDDTKTDEKTDEKPENKPSDGGISLGDLRDLIKEEVSSIVDSLKPNTERSGSQSTESRNFSITEEVRREVEKLRTADDANREKMGLMERLGKLEEAIGEKPPVQRTRRHKFMGWGE